MRERDIFLFFFIKELMSFRNILIVKVCRNKFFLLFDYEINFVSFRKLEIASSEKKNISFSIRRDKKSNPLSVALSFKSTHRIILFPLK